MGSRDEILEKLYGKTIPIALCESAYDQHVVPDVSDYTREMLDRFIAESEKLSCTIHQAANETKAVEAILAIVNDEKTIMCWAFDQIGLPSLEGALAKRGIGIDNSYNPETRCGITGVERALAATGSLVLASGTGKDRATSLLPLVHIAVLHAAQIVKDLESWFSFAQQDEGSSFQEASNIVVISGPSKTADIAMELVMGMHGPQELHIVILTDEIAA